MKMTLEEAHKEFENALQRALHDKKCAILRIEDTYLEQVNYARESYRETLQPLLNKHKTKTQYEKLREAH